MAHETEHQRKPRREPRKPLKPPPAPAPAGPSKQADAANPPAEQKPAK